MTFDANISTTWGSFLADIRDKVSGLANWSIKDDTSGGAAELAAGDSFVLTTPIGEDIRVMVSTGNGVTIEHGPNWNASNDAWDDRYAHDYHNRYPAGSDNETVAPVNGDTSQVGMSDSVNYWLGYADAEGFIGYCERQVGDGYDYSFMLGFAELTQTWDYDTAANRESNYAMDIGGGSWYNYDGYFSNSQRLFNYMSASPQEHPGETTDGYGQVNPDSNYGNYPVTENVVSSSTYVNGAGHAAIIGTHDVWVDDRSGGDSAHQDSVTDGGGSTLYTICKANSFLNVGVKHL